MNVSQDEEREGATENSETSDAEVINADVNADASQDTSSHESESTTQVDSGSPEGGESAESQTTKTEFDISTVPLDTLLQREDVRRAIQSQKDKEIAEERKRIEAERRKQEEDAKRERLREEIRKLAQEPDSEEKTQKLAELGKKNVDQFLEEDADYEAAKRFTSVIEENLMSNPAFDGISRERKLQIADDIKANDGTVSEFMVKLHEEATAAAIEKERMSVRELVQQELAAQRESEAGVQQTKVQERSQRANSGQAVQESVTTGAAKKPVSELTYEEASELYGRGELSTTEFEPFRKAHISRQI